MNYDPTFPKLSSAWFLVTLFLAFFFYSDKFALAFGHVCQKHQSSFNLLINVWDFLTFLAIADNKVHKYFNSQFSH